MKYSHHKIHTNILYMSNSIPLPRVTRWRLREGGREGATLDPVVLRGPLSTSWEGAGRGVAGERIWW